MSLRLRLAPDWDTPIQPPTADGTLEGRFVGRRRERQMLAHELSLSKQRSIFVSGYRGVGKTSLVYRALHDIVEGSNRKFLLVILNAAQLEAGAENEAIEPRAILLNLIRRLYTAAKRSTVVSDERKDEIFRLYSKAIASEFAEKREFRELAQREESSERTVLLNLDATLQRALAVAAGLSGGALAEWLGPGNWFGDYVATPAVAVASGLVAAIGYRSARNTKSKTDQAERAEVLYAFDGSLGNLEFDLEEVHAGLASDEITTVYVLDELDKIKPDTVLNVLRFFKHLFTLSSAIFIFVGGEELEDAIRQRAEEDNRLFRAREYTFFTSQYFLSRPSFDEIHSHLADIITVERSDD